MTSERDERIREIFLEAVACKGGERQALIEIACGEDLELRREVETLLAEDEAQTDGRWKRAGPLRVEPFGSDGEPYGQAIPTRIGDYELLKPIGTGGMGSVYLAKQTSLGREVAVKLVHPGVPIGKETLERFLREARAAARVEHASIVSVLEAGVEGGLPFIAMQLVRGVSLQEVLARGGRFPPERALAIVRDIALAVQAAHDAGVVHRDIKPGNILVEGNAQSAREKGRVYLGDFGLAVLTDAASLTPSANIMGTPAYMSPEQARGERVGKLSDIYSLGATLYALLSGRAPHEGTSYLEMVGRVAREDPIPLARLVPSIPRDATLICEMAMRWEARKRYASAGEFAEDIDRCLNRKPISARSATVRYRASLWMKRNPRTVKIAALVALAACLAFLVERGIRRDAILHSVEQKVCEQSFVEARAKLGDLPWVPWPRGARREASLRLQVALGNVDLSAAAVALSQIDAPDRAEAYRGLCWTVDEVLDEAEAFLGAGMWRTALLDLRNVAGALSYLLSPSLEPELPAHWLAAVSDRVVSRTETVLLDRDRDRDAVDLLDAQCKADFVAVRDIIGRVLRISGDSLQARPQETDTLVARLVAQKYAPSGRSSPGSADAGTRTADILAVLDDYLPSLEAPQIRRALVSFLSLSSLGDPVKVDVPLAQDVGDLDGDSWPELALAGGDPKTQTQNQIQIVRWSASGLEKLPPLRLELPGEETPLICTVSLEDLEDDGRSEIIVYYTLSRTAGFVSGRGYLRAYGLERGSLAQMGVDFPPPGLSPLGASVCERDAVIRSADTDSDGKKELIVGTTSSGTQERSLLVITEPFDKGARYIELPAGGKTGDITSVFCGDFDRDGKPEVGCVTGPWKGFDIRFWKHDTASGRYVGPLRFGPFGMFDLALALDTDEDNVQELFLAKSGCYEPNIEQFPRSPNRGLAPGAYLFRMPEGTTVKIADVPVDTSRWERDFLWSYRFSEDLTYPRDTWHAMAASTAPWLRRNAAAVSWRTKISGRLRHFVDVYAQDWSSSRFATTRLFEREGPGGLIGHLVRFPPGPGEAPRPGLLTVEWGEETGASAVVRAWAFTPPKSVRPATQLRRAQAYLRTGRYAKATQLARQGLAAGPATEDAVSLALHWACAAVRNLDWPSTGDALKELGRLAGATNLTRLPARAERLGAEPGALEKILRRVEGLVGEPTPRLSVEEVLVEGRSAEGLSWCQAYLSEQTVHVSEPSDLQISFELSLGRVGWNEFIVAGLCATGSHPQGNDGGESWKQSAYGVRLIKSGGSGQEFIQVSWIWPGVRELAPDVLKQLKEGSTYRFTFLRTAEGRLRLKVEDIGRIVEEKGRVESAPPCSRPTAFSLAYPAYEEEEAPETDDSKGEITAPIQPLAAGYRFAVWEGIGKGGAREARLALRNIQLRLREIPKREAEGGGK